MYFAVSSHGVLSKQDMLKGLEEERICPVMVYEQDGVQTVPVFASANLAYQFARRNTPKKFFIGNMLADEEDMQNMRDAGFTVVELTWPNKRVCDMHMLEMSRPVETHESGDRANNPFGRRTK